jgi:hypothetical protein
VLLSYAQLRRIAPELAKREVYRKSGEKKKAFYVMQQWYRELEQSEQ